ncbi:MAG: hypothetical protein M3Y21_01535 [Candidatus Eremiobacteraeota bacterium]|nr:hypothetical protein [Candidatus Eremiobacteraeota bacterium]
MMDSGKVASKKIRSARQKPRQRQASWEISADGVVRLKPKAQSDFAIMPKLERLVKSLGLSSAANVLGVDRSQLSRCIKGTENVSAELARRITSVEFVLDRALHLLWPDEIGPWLTTPEPLLGGSIPLNVLVLSGPAQVVGALEARAGGAFA